MNAVRLFTKTTYPEWYRLGFDPSEMKIRIAFGPQVLEYLVSFDLKEAISLYGKGMTHFEGFQKDSRFGFMGVFCPARMIQSGLYSWEAQLPVFKSNRIENESTDDHIQGLRATLALLFNVLYLFEGESSSNISQSIVMDGFMQGVGGGEAGLSAIITPSTAKWIAEHEDHLAQVRDDMMTANHYMWSKSKLDPFWFKAEYKKGRGLGLCVNSGARNLTYGGNSDLKDNRGYEMHPHNIDSPLDQFTLLVGLCSLCQRAAATSL